MYYTILEIDKCEYFLIEWDSYDCFVMKLYLSSYLYCNNDYENRT